MNTIGSNYAALIRFAKYLANDKDFSMNEVFDVLATPRKWQKEYTEWLALEDRMMAEWFAYDKKS